MSNSDDNKEIEMVASNDEETANKKIRPSVVEGPDGNIMLTKTFNIEWLRFWGLMAGSVLLITGTIVTNNFVEWPKGSGGFDFTATFIYELFHFNHTCTVLDFNPSRTVSGLVMMFHTIPMDLFIILSYYRIKHKYRSNDPHIPKWLWMYTKITTPFIFTFMTYFYMVFVNPPFDMPSFILHYIPYMCWQITMVLMAIGQCGYVANMEIIPLGIPRILVRVYLFILILTGTFYTVFVWSFVNRTPILDTTIASRRHFAIFLMYFFDLIAAIIPAILAFIEARNGHAQTILFFNTEL